MRKTMAVAGLALMSALAPGCSDRAEKAAAADANAVDFVPPSVTSRVDYAAQQQRRFRRLDRDGSSVLTGPEMPRRNPRLMALDANTDGRITQGEFSDGTNARFDAMDLNKDGTLTSDERIAGR
ncbi:MAG TPA: hypothetical protein VFQ57_03795 [Sphingomonas sp.]|jgi:hypothetical protein|nr:hypothetical protein [Sphingomonas sp.]